MPPGRKSRETMNPKDGQINNLNPDDELMKWVNTAAKSGNSNALRLKAQLEGRLDKGSESGFEFGPKEYIRVAREITEQLRADYKEHSRNCPVCGRPNFLFNEVCVPSEQEHGADNQVEALAVPAGLDDDSSIFS